MDAPLFYEIFDAAHNFVWGWNPTLQKIPLVTTYISGYTGSYLLGTGIMKVVDKIPSVLKNTNRFQKEGSFLENKLFPTVKRTTRKAMPWALVTAGLLLNKEVTDVITEYPNYSMGITGAYFGARRGLKHNIERYNFLERIGFHRKRD